MTRCEEVDDIYLIKLLNSQVWMAMFRLSKVNSNAPITSSSGWVSSISLCVVRTCMKEGERILHIHLPVVNPVLSPLIRVEMRGMGEIWEKSCVKPQMEAKGVMSFSRVPFDSWSWGCIRENDLPRHPWSCGRAAANVDAVYWLLWGFC